MERIVVKLFTLCIFLSFSELHAQSVPKRTFPLPEIKEMTFLSVPSALERIFPPNSCHDGLPKLLKTYDKRLHNIRNYEVYLVKRSCEMSQGTCLCFETSAQGDFNFLLLYDRRTKRATVLVASYGFLSDSEFYSMRFKIANNQIKLTDSGFTDGENEAEEYSKEVIHVSVENGAIKVLPERVNRNF